MRDALLFSMALCRFMTHSEWALHKRYPEKHRYLAQRERMLVHLAR